MKKMFALAAVLCLALAGCEYDDAEVKDRLDDLEGRVDALEKTVNSLNINVGNLQSLIDGKLFITAVTENPEGGGYTLSLVTSDGEASQIVIKDGEAGAAPAIGVKLDSDGKYYWTLDGEFITDDRYDSGRQIFAAAEQDGVRRECWISLDYGLLTESILKREGETVYDALQTGLEILAAGDEAFDDVFVLPDGTSPFQ